MFGVLRQCVAVGVVAGVAVGCQDELPIDPASSAEAPASEEQPREVANTLGSLDRVEIDDVIRNHMDPIRSCYQQGLIGDPALEGDIAVKFVIAQDGFVSSATAKSTTLPDPVVVDCILGAIEGLQFPEPRDGGIVIVTYPFRFTAG